MAAPGGTALSPAFVAFFNRAAAFSEAMYPGGSVDPQFTYKLTWLPSEGLAGLSLQIDGQSMDFSAGNVSKQFTWHGTGLHLEKATVRLSPGAGLGLPDHEGPWAMFHFFAESDSRVAAKGGGELFEWAVRSGAGNKPLTDAASGKPLVVRLVLDMNGPAPVFEKNYFARLGCIAQVSK